MKTLIREAGRTVRAAIGGWGPTARLVTIIAFAVTACIVLYRMI